jgi:hypothetical protein
MSAPRSHFTYAALLPAIAAGPRAENTVDFSYRLLRNRRRRLAVRRARQH